MPSKNMMLTDLADLAAKATPKPVGPPDKYGRVFYPILGGSALTTQRNREALADACSPEVITALVAVASIAMEDERGLGHPDECNLYMGWNDHTCDCGSADALLQLTEVLRG